MIAAFPAGAGKTAAEEHQVELGVAQRDHLRPVLARAVFGGQLAGVFTLHGEFRPGLCGVGDFHVFHSGQGQRSGSENGDQRPRTAKRKAVQHGVLLKAVIVQTIRVQCGTCR